MYKGKDYESADESKNVIEMLTYRIFTNQSFLKKVKLPGTFTFLEELLKNAS